MAANDELTISEAAKIVGVSRQAIFAAVDRGVLPYVERTIHVRRVRLEDVRAYIASTGGTVGRPRKGDC